jgi:hypothetical protein
MRDCPPRSGEIPQNIDNKCLMFDTWDGSGLSIEAASSKTVGMMKQ